jgi:hypothetical protein
VPNKEFIEQYPLYRKFHVLRMPAELGSLPEVRINMICTKCASSQTFELTNKYYERFGIINYPVEGVVLHIINRCTHCQFFERVFFVKIDQDKQWMMRVGQFPPWETAGDKNLEALLGKHSGY